MNRKSKIDIKENRKNCVEIISIARNNCYQASKGDTYFMKYCADEFKEDYAECKKQWPESIRENLMMDKELLSK
jgi:hypothetical protein